MVVLHDVLGFEVKVIVDGQPLNEFEDNEAETRPATAETYVEAPLGGTFQVKYCFNKPFHSSFEVHAEIDLDGNEILTSERRYKEDLSFETGTETYCLHGSISYENGVKTRRNFQFSELTIEEGAKALTTKLAKEVGALGTIVVRFYYIKNVQNQEDHFIPVQEYSQWDTVPEKALKGKSVSQQASLSEPEAVTKGGYQVLECVSNTPFATVLYKYRSNAALRSLRIIPRSPSPQPVEQAVELEPDNGMTDEEVRRAYRELIMRSSQRGVKRERSETDETTNPAPDDDEVRFVGARKRHRQPPRAGQLVVDLDD